MAKKRRLSTRRIINARHLDNDVSTQEKGNSQKGVDFEQYNAGGRPAPQGATELTHTVPLIPEQEMREIMDIIQREAGIHLTSAKRALVTGRLYPLLLEKGIPSYADYIELVKKDPSGDMVSQLVDRISTNHTAFFRENKHFEYLVSHVLPELEAAKTRAGSHDLRIWCAACSTGEEAYSIQISLLQYFGIRYPQWTAGVLATDISFSALKAARAGIYSASRFEDVPDAVQKAYFKPVENGAYKIEDTVRKEVTFRRLNLTCPTFPFRSGFDIIFCRNVMIYFDSETRKSLVKKMYDATLPGGYLFTGHSESIMDHDTRYVYVRPSVYKRENE